MRTICAIGAALALFCGSVSARQARGTPAPPAPPIAVGDLIARAFNSAYNLDHEAAIADARQAIAMAPDEPITHRTLASILWLRILFLRGAVTVDTYLGTVSKSLATLPKPPADVDAEFKRELTLATSLAEARLKKNAHDVQAEFDAGAAYALQASYTASVEGSMMSAFNVARRAYSTQEDVLTHDPNRAGASVIVGTYRYLVSTFSLPTRLLAYIAGFGGDKQKGISLIEAASRDRDAHTDAMFALILIYSREGRHEDARRVINQLMAEFPRNRILMLESGAAALRAGHPAEAETILTQGLVRLATDRRPRIPGEQALWLFKRGAARVALGRQAEALADLTAAGEQEPVPWVSARLHLELGKVADLGGRRADALAEYRQARTLCDAAQDPLGSAEAARLLRQPYTIGGRTP